MGVAGGRRWLQLCHLVKDKAEVSSVLELAKRYKGEVSSVLELAKRDKAEVISVLELLISQ